MQPSGYAAAQYREQIAAAWVFMSCVAVWAEDHGLQVWVIRDTGQDGVSALGDELASRHVLDLLHRRRPDALPTVHHHCHGC